MKFASEYYEKDLDVNLVKKIYAFEPLTSELAKLLNAEVKIDPNFWNKIKNAEYPYSE